jgi:hypothetical protein
MLTIIQYKIFCLPISYKKLKIKIYKTLHLASIFEGGTQTEGFWEHSVEEDIWT